MDLLDAWQKTNAVSRPFPTVTQGAESRRKAQERQVGSGQWVVVSLSCLSLILPFRVVREFSGWWPVVGDQWLVASCQWLDVPFGLSVHFPRRLIM